MRIPRALAMIGLYEALLPAPARGQAWRWQPSVTMWERNDDNLFSRAQATEQDWITGLEPRLLLSHDHQRWSLQVQYGQAAERYAAHPRLDALAARQDGWLRWESRATRSLDASLTATYLRTATAGELYRSSGIDFGRVPARRLQLTPALAQRLSGVTTLSADVTATRDEVEGTGVLDSAVAGMRLDHRLSARALLSVRGETRWYDVGAGATRSSQLLALGYRRTLGRTLELGLDAGPRISGGAASAEWLGSLRSRGQRGEWAIECGQSEAPVVGAASGVVTRRVGASVSRSAGPLSGRVALDLLQSRGGLEARAWQASAAAFLRLGDPLAIALASSWSRQRSDSPAAIPGEVSHVVTELRLVLGPGRRRENVDVR